MKILNIRIKNLNSLRGEYFIDFEATPLKGSGLFLITGNTGAGKSTILDAITLALFGLVPRFEDMTISKKETQIITYGTTDSYAQVEFESENEVYRCSWKMGKTRNDTFRDSVRELAKISPDRQSSELLATKKKDVDDLVEKLLGGLNFKRFTRSVLLAQGEFAQFLKGTEDRSTILERITNSDRYSKISMAAFERHKLAQLELDKLVEQSSQVQLLSSEEKVLLEEKLEADTQIHAAQNKDLEAQQQALQLLAKLEELLQEKEKLQGQLEHLQTQQKEAEVDRLRLATHQQASVFKPALDELEKSNSAAEVLNLEIENLQKTIAATQEKVQKLKNRHDEILAQLQTSKERYADFEKIYDAVVQLDVKLEGEEKLVLDLKKEAQQLAENLDNKSKILAKSEKEKELLLEQQEATKNWLKEHQIYAPLVGSDIVFELGKQCEDLQKYQELFKAGTNKKNATQTKIKKLETDSEQLQHQALENTKSLREQESNYQKMCKESGLDTTLSHQELLDYLQGQNAQSDLLLQALQKIETERKEQKKIQENLIEIDEEIEHKQAELNEKDQSFLKFEEQLESIRKQEGHYETCYDLLKEKQNLSAFRGKLKEEEECPLCYSKEQPFRKMDIDIDYSLQKAAQDHKNAKDKRSKIEKDYQDIVGLQRVLFAQIQNFQKSKTEVFQKLLAVEDRVRLILDDKNLNILPVIHQSDVLQEKIEDTSSLIKKYNALEKTLQQIQYDIENCRTADKNIATQLQQNNLHLKDFKQQNEEQDVEIAHYAKNIQETQSSVNEQLKHFELGEDLAEAVKILTEHKENYAKQQALQLEQLAKLERIAVQISTAQEQIQELQTSQKIKQEEYETHFNHLSQLQKERQNLFSGSSISEAKELFVKELEDLNKSLESHAQQSKELEQQLATSEGVLSEKNKQLAVLKAFVQDKEPALLQAIAAIGMDSLEQLKKSILDKETADAIAKQQQDLQQQLHTISEKIKNNSTQYEERQQQFGKDLAEKTALLEAYQILKEAVENLLQNIGSIKEQLRHQTAQEQKFKTLLEEISKHKKEVARWGVLKDLIGSSDGKKFRVFAQSITLKKLIYLANQHLSYFVNGRYYLAKRFEDYQDKNPDAMLEIDIVDTYQANNKRPLNTLSGGESFLASLALALGLSDLAGGNAAIESLFIDEGFGTLDSDTLQVAIKALQTLQLKGKTIGIISHIEQLKQSISTQIHVVKRGSGFSEIRVLEN